MFRYLHWSFLLKADGSFSLPIISQREWQPQENSNKEVFYRNSFTGAKVLFPGGWVPEPGYKNPQIQLNITDIPLQVCEIASVDYCSLKRK